MFFKTGAIRNFAIFTRKHMCWSLFLIKLQALQLATLFQPHVIPVIISKYLFRLQHR